MDSSIQATLLAAFNAWQRGDADQAAGLIGDARFDPLPDAWLLRGVTARQRNDFPTAEHAYLQALALKPDYASAQFNLGNLYAASGNHAAACERFASAAGNRNGDIQAERALVLLAVSAYALGDVERAFAALRQALAINPNDAGTWNQQGKMHWELGETAAAVASFRHAVANAPEELLYRSNLLLVSQFAPEMDEAALAQLAQAAARLIAANAPRPTVPLQPARHPRLRIAYLSSDFRISAPGFFIDSILAGHDRQTFEVWALATGPCNDIWSQRLRQHVDRWEDVSALSDAALTDWLRQQQLDILVDLNGYTGGHRLAVFATRAAPLQVSWLGYEGTTQLPGMDILLADRQVVPNANLGSYSETVLRLPWDFCCYSPPTWAPPVASTPALRNGYVTFGSFNKLAKLSAPTVALWSRILHAVPDSRLMLKWRHAASERVRNRLCQAFTAHGIDAGRLLFRDASPHAELLAEYGDIDIALDPVTFSGGATTCDALWMGVPVITQYGKRFASNHTVSHLQAAGLPELVATDADAYVTIAGMLAQDAAALDRLRQSIRPQMQLSPLCDSPLFMRAAERMLLAACSQARQRI